MQSPSLQPATPQPASAAASAGVPPSTHLAGPSGGYFSSAFGCMHECFLVGPGEQRDVVFPSHLYFTIYHSYYMHGTLPVGTAQPA